MLLINFVSLIYFLQKQSGLLFKVMAWGKFRQREEVIDKRLFLLQEEMYLNTVSKRKTKHCWYFSCLLQIMTLHFSQGNIFLSTFCCLLFIAALRSFGHQVVLGCKQAHEETRTDLAAIRQHLTRLSPSVILSSEWPLLSVFLSALYIFLLSCLLLVSLACCQFASALVRSAHPAGFISCCLAQLLLHMCLLMSQTLSSHCAVDVKSQVRWVLK